MKRLLIILALFLPSLCSAQVFRYQDLCKVGGQTATVQGLNSSNDLIGSYPGCTVDVFISGTGTHATIYSDSGMTPLGNPFTADVIYGTYGFYAAAGCYDVVTSGAGMPAPQTQSAICLATSVTAGTVTSVTDTNNASSLISVSIANQTTTPAFTFGLTQFGAHTFWGNGTGSTATPSATVIGVGDLPFTYSGNTTVLVTAGTISGTASPLCTDASGNATTSGCPSASGYSIVQDEGTPLTQRGVLNFTGAGVNCVDDSGSIRTNCVVGSSYSTVQDEGTPLTQRSTVNFTGAGITCSDISSVTTCDVPSAGGGGITGTLTSGRIPVATGATTLADSNLSISGNTVTSQGAALQLMTTSVSSGNGLAILATSGTTSDVSAHSGTVGLVTANSSGGTGSGDATIQTGSTNNAGVAGDINVLGAANSGTVLGGNINLIPGNGTSQGGLIKCNNSALGLGCSIDMHNAGNTGEAILMAGSGVPSGNCQAPLTHPQVTSVPILYLRTNPADASTFLYVCIPPSTWTAVTIP